MTPASIAFLATGASAAAYAERTHGVPAQVMLAQAIYESGWGKDAPGNNCLGIKANGRGCGTRLQPTHEFINGKEVTQNLAFEVYATLEACFEDYAWLISHGAPYAAAFAAYAAGGSMDAFTLAIGKVYATAPGYGETILNFAKSPTITDALKKTEWRPRV